MTQMQLVGRLTPELYTEAMLQVIKTYGIKNFTPDELCKAGETRAMADQKGRFTLQAPWPWQLAYALPTLLLMQEARNRFGPLRILSGYRDPVHNAQIKGSEQSLHMAFNAFDLRPLDAPLHALAQWLHRHPQRASIGLGCYSWGLHLDTRGLLLPWQRGQVGLPSDRTGSLSTSWRGGSALHQLLGAAE